MNDRIRELAEEANKYALGNWTDTYNNLYNEKFAELIVQECADQCTHDGPFTAEVVWGKQFRKKILKHFGIDE